MQIKIINKIADAISLHQLKTGTTKTWISKQLNITNQRLFAIMQADNFNLDTLIKISILLNCSITDLFDYEIVTKD